MAEKFSKKGCSLFFWIRPVGQWLADDLQLLPVLREGMARKQHAAGDGSDGQQVAQTRT
ncbi:hypothetical protein LP417_12610 [Polaromonas sp. P1-6]|nr:hypothetical protein LP417_12610 [Polaromonas sp. P1-6]